MRELRIQLMERMLVAELTAHLDYEDGKDAPLGQLNRRNGTLRFLSQTSLPVITVRVTWPAC